MLTLNLINEIDFDEYFKQAIIGYAKEKVTSSNWTEEEALERAEKEFTYLLPNGEKTEDHYIYSIFKNNAYIEASFVSQLLASVREHKRRRSRYTK